MVAAEEVVVAKQPRLIHHIGPDRHRSQHTRQHIEDKVSSRVRLRADGPSSGLRLHPDAAEESPGKAGQACAEREAHTNTNSGHEIQKEQTQL